MREADGSLAGLKGHVIVAIGGFTPPQGGSVALGCNTGVALDHDGASIKSLSHASTYCVILCLLL